MPTFDTIQQGADNRNLVRKIQKAVALLAPKSVALPDSLYVSGTLMDFETAGWKPVGLISPDGYSFSREVEKENIDALGYASPVRSDVTTVPRQVSFTALEKGRRHMLELTLGTDLSAVTQNTTTGEIVVDEPDLPVDAEYRLLVIGSDGATSDNWIMGRGYGLVKLANGGSETWGREGAVSTEITLDVYTDDEIGVPVRHYIAGTGAVAAAADLGFTAAPVTP
ncbi:hypothetical protein [Micrococcus sp. TA1]|uniref:hypothetical protein n=1 Tax=Micrococcus sp. TA1 TaxID=681627 RepID=UPI0016074B66|nr:hypothetical protein [Micrococcus sp. TA1]MBB5748536.1 hypothetical protein [Micrococcus sp. TA1]